MRRRGFGLLAQGLHAAFFAQHREFAAEAVGFGGSDEPCHGRVVVFEFDGFGGLDEVELSSDRVRAGLGAAQGLDRFGFLGTDSQVAQGFRLGLGGQVESGEGFLCAVDLLVGEVYAFVVGLDLADDFDGVAQVLAAFGGSSTT
ncbi:hypothetical protein [Nocardia sp. IFM 10818]